MLVYCPNLVSLSLCGAHLLVPVTSNNHLPVDKDKQQLKLIYGIFKSSSVGFLILLLHSCALRRHSSWTYLGSTDIWQFCHNQQNWYVCVSGMCWLSGLLQAKAWLKTSLEPGPVRWLYKDVIRYHSAAWITANHCMALEKISWQSNPVLATAEIFQSEVVYRLTFIPN